MEVENNTFKKAGTIEPLVQCSFASYRGCHLYNCFYFCLGCRPFDPLGGWGVGESLLCLDSIGSQVLLYRSLFPCLFSLTSGLLIYCDFCCFSVVQLQFIRIPSLILPPPLPHTHKPHTHRPQMKWLDSYFVT